MKTKLSNSLKGARNIGITIEKRLNEIGVFSLADLAQMTPVKAYQKICKQHPDKTFPVCYNLYSSFRFFGDRQTWRDFPFY